ncbi:hypothetical protein ACWERI_34215 [Streptomyces collinus]
MTTVWLMVSGAASAVGLALMSMVSDEIRGRLERLPAGLLMLAACRVPQGPDRETMLEEWLAEVRAVQMESPGLPLRRLWRSTRYALGIWRTARLIHDLRSGPDRVSAAARRLQRRRVMWALRASGHTSVGLVAVGFLALFLFVVGAFLNAVLDSGSAFAVDHAGLGWTLVTACVVMLASLGVYVFAADESLARRAGWCASIALTAAVAYLIEVVATDQTSPNVLVVIAGVILSSAGALARSTRLARRLVGRYRETRAAVEPAGVSQGGRGQVVSAGSGQPES